MRYLYIDKSWFNKARDKVPMIEPESMHILKVLHFHRYNTTSLIVIIDWV